MVAHLPMAMIGRLMVVLPQFVFFYPKQFFQVIEDASARPPHLQGVVQLGRIVEIQSSLKSQVISWNPWIGHDGMH